jgi:hypothetical protein
MILVNRINNNIFGTDLIDLKWIYVLIMSDF